MITGNFPNLRLRRSRKNDWSRRLIAENNLTPNDFILPVFLIDGKNKKQKINSMPGVHRYSLDKLSLVIDKALKLKLPMIALFPYTNKKDKDRFGTEALNEDNLVKTGKNFQKELKRIKECSFLANDLGIEVHAGHGLDYKTTKILNKIKAIKEFNIGHFIIGESVFLGLNDVVKKFKTIIK